VDGCQVGEDAVLALKLVDVDPRRAWKQAWELMSRSRLDRDHATASVAARAAGLAALHMTNLDTAVELLTQAVASARRTHSARLVSEALMSLAFILMRRGNTRRALRTIDAALTDLTGVDRARVLAQRGAIRQQLGHLDEALADYRAAMPTLRREQDWTWVQRVHSNRSVLYIYRSQLGPAAVELQSAEAVCRRYGLHLQLAFVYDNLAFLHVRRGDVPAALHWLDAAEQGHTSLGAQAGAVLLDRSELLMSVGLVAEARATAVRAVEEFTRLRRQILLPQAQLLVAETALLDGDATAARTAAEAAIRAFRAQQRPEWVALARYTALRCRLRDACGEPVTVPDLARAATALDSVGWTVPAMDARLVAARLALERGDARRAESLLRRTGAVRRRGPVELRARAWHAEALRRLAQGSRRSAATALHAGIRVLEDYQATLPAADVRSTVSGHRADLVELGLRLALRSGRPRRVLVWAERGRATALLMQPLRPPDDPVLAQLLVELRAAVAQIEAARTAGRTPDGLISRQSGLERAIRDHVRALPGATVTARRPTADEIGSALGDAVLVEYVEHRDALFAVTIAGSRVRLTPLRPTAGVHALLSHVPFALRRLARRNPGRPADARAGAAMQLLDDAGTRLDDLLLQPLRQQIEGRPMVIVPTGPLQSILWGGLPSCAGRPVSVAPSAALWYQAATADARPGHVVVAAGPELPEAPVEAAAVAALYPGARLLTGAGATVGAVKAALGDCSVAHVAAHGRFRSDNPLFSSLRLVDGPLTVYDLDSLPRAPAVVVLAACDGGTSLVSAGDELLGLAAGFLAHGATALVGPLGPVCDGAMADLMIELHKELRAGTPPATALARVQDAVSQGPPAMRAAAASLVCLGAGHAAVPVRAA